MSTSFESVILPERPLVLVHKGWCVDSKNQDKGKPSNLAPKGTIPMNPKISAFKAVKVDYDSGLPLQKVPSKAQETTAFKSFKFVNRTPKTQAARLVHRTKKDTASSSSEVNHRKQRSRNSLDGKEITATVSQRGNTSLKSTTNNKYRTTTSSVEEHVAESIRSMVLARHLFVNPVPKNARFYVSFYERDFTQLAYPLVQLLSYNPVLELWLPKAISDPLWFNGALYISAALLMKSKGIEIAGLDCLVLMDAILRALAKRIAEERCFSDSTIGVVSCLTLMENLEGNSEKSWAHYVALSHMIRTRGGLWALERTMHTKTFRALTDIAATLDRPPLLTPEEIRYDRPTANPPTAFPLTLARSSPPIPCPLPRTSHSLIRPILAEAAHLSVLLSSGWEKPVDPFVLDTTVYSQLQQLILLPERVQREDGVALCGRDDAVRLGLVLYHMTLTKPISWMPVYTERVLVGKLIHAMERWDREEREEDGRSDSVDPTDESVREGEINAQLKAWVSILGAMATRPDTEMHEKFLRELKVAARGFLGPRNDWAGMRDVLEKFAWVSVVHDRTGMELWESCRMEENSRCSSCEQRGAR